MRSNTTRVRSARKRSPCGNAVASHVTSMRPVNQEGKRGGGSEIYHTENVDSSGKSVPTQKADWNLIFKWTVLLVTILAVYAFVLAVARTYVPDVSVSEVTALFAALVGGAVLLLKTVAAITRRRE